MKLPPTDTGACGTANGYRRHMRAGQTFCQPCREAEKTRKRNYGKEPRMTAHEIAAEIQFLLHCGEGTDRILKAVGYHNNTANLKSRLYRNGYDHLNQALFGEAA